MKRTRALLTTVLPVALAATLILTGCSGGNDFDGTSGSGGKGDTKQNCAPSGSASDSVKIDGKLGGEVKLKAKTPIAVKSLERTVALKGDGEKLGTGDAATVQMTVFNGKTGEMIAPGAPTTIVNDPSKISEWAAKAVGCSAIGDRVVIVTPASEILGAGQGAAYQLEDTDALVAVFDFTGTPLTRAEGKAVKAPAGFPEVELGDDGKPTITMPKGEKAPKKLEIATLIQGDGDTVKDGDTVSVHYVGAIWRTGEVFNSSWDMGTPATFPVTYPNGVIKGFYKALVGAKVGSQVIAVVPASAGYGDNTESQLKGSASDIKNDDVLVFVVDVLSTAHAAK